MGTFQLPHGPRTSETTPVAAEGIRKKKGGKEAREKKKDHWRGGLDNLETCVARSVVVFVL